ncbi:MAG TPA: hypothetical protein VFK51_05265 [Burkholderiales bacterium]|jgi:drug/metabolite transporter (DMT)-like permease|nr:hypothetical protein [Burkholderiales bacterium]
MDERIRKRIVMFYLGGAVNLAAGLYLLLFGQSLLPGRQALWLGIVFLVFAAIDFYFPSVLKKRAAAARDGTGTPPPSKS